MKRRRTWWATRWQENLQLKPLRRGAGRQHLIAVKLEGVDPERNEALLLVSGGSVVPEEVRIRIKPLDDEVWEQVAGELAQRAIYGASLLVGELPRRVEDVFRKAGVSLFPSSGEVRARCNCGSPPPCRHINQAQHALLDAIEADPFLLFELRGRRPAQILDILGLPEDTKAQPGEEQDAEVPERPFRRAAGELSDFHFHIAPPPREGALLAVLGNPRGWRDTKSLREELLPAVIDAATTARELAYEHEDDDDAAST